MDIITVTIFTRAGMTPNMIWTIMDTYLEAFDDAVSKNDDK